MLLVEFIFCFFLGGKKLSRDYLAWLFRPSAVLAFSLKNTMVMLIAYLIINTVSHFWRTRTSHAMLSLSSLTQNLYTIKKLGGKFGISEK